VQHKKKRKQPFDEALAKLQDQYSKAGGKDGKLSLETINGYLRSQIQANEESGET
jgi:hypothetical protein